MKDLTKKIIQASSALCGLLVGLCSCSPTASVEADYASYVNPFIGTGGHGHTYPGAMVPNGMIQPSPATRTYQWDACSGYYDADSTIIGLNRMETSRMKIFLENRKMSKIWTPQVEGVMYPISQVPADKKFLPTFAWFDYVRPLNKDDIFNWRPKKSGSELKEVKRKVAPLPTLN